MTYWAQYLCQWRHKPAWHEGEFVAGIFDYLLPIKADYCSTLLPEPVPVVSQNKQRRFHNKSDACLLLPWHFSCLWLLTWQRSVPLTPSPPLVQWLHWRRGTLSCIVKLLWFNDPSMHWPTHSLTQHAALHLLTIMEVFSPTRDASNDYFHSPLIWRLFYRFID